MKKADMEAHQAQYKKLINKARTAEREGLYTQTVELALASWDYVDGMMLYERKYNNNDFSSIWGIDLILKYAPLLLDFPSLDKLEGLLKSCRRIEKNTSECLAEKLSEARSFLHTSHRLWNHIENNPETRQDQIRKKLGGQQKQWDSIAEKWEQMGLLQRTPENGSYRLSLSTRLGQLIVGKCSSCGEITEAPKAMLLEKVTCPQCNNTAWFVITSTKIDANIKG